MAHSTTIHLQQCLDRLRAGEESARAELIATAADRLRLLSSQMLRRYPNLRGWEQSDDIAQNATMRLMRSLESVHPETPLDFLRLAATQIRRELIDLTRSHFGPMGSGRHREPRAPDSTYSRLRDLPDQCAENPADLALWTEFHSHVDALPDEDRSLFDLLWYQGIDQQAAADMLGVSLRTVKSRWRNAKLRLHDNLGGQLPAA